MMQRKGVLTMWFHFGLNCCFCALGLYLLICNVFFISFSGYWSCLMIVHRDKFIRVSLLFENYVYLFVNNLNKIDENTKLAVKRHRSLKVLTTWFDHISFSKTLNTNITNKKVHLHNHKLHCNGWLLYIVLMDLFIYIVEFQ